MAVMRVPMALLYMVLVIDLGLYEARHHHHVHTHHHPKGRHRVKQYTRNLPDHDAEHYHYYQYSDHENNGQDYDDTHYYNAEHLEEQLTEHPESHHKLPRTPCNGGTTLTGLTGVVPSPRAARSNLYPENVNCTWRLVAPTGRRLWLRSSIFNIEETTNCTYDYLQVHDGNGPDDPILAKLCGAQFPPEGLNSTGNSMYLYFHSDRSVVRRGFRLRFTAQALTPQGSGIGLGVFATGGTGAQPTGGTGTQSMGGTGAQPTGGTGPQSTGGRGTGIVLGTAGSTVIAAGTIPAPSVPCGGQLTVTGHVTSPGYDISKKYPNNAKCEWIIDAGEKKIVKLHFKVFDVEYSSSCLYDSLSVYDGQNKTAPLIDSYCGSHLPEALRSTGRYLYLVFVSDSSMQGSGFNAEYSPEDRPVDLPTFPGCHSATRPVVLRGLKGDVTCPTLGSKRHYPDKTICQWKIKVPQGKRAHIHFTRFSLEPDDEGCRYDYVELFDGEDTSAQRLGRYCGENSPGDITATGNTLLVQFRSDDSVTSLGFAAMYSAKAERGSTDARNNSGEPPCGIPEYQPKFARIVGGTEAAPYSWPWQVSLRYFGHHFCGGTVISRRWVLTAAHCLVSEGHLKFMEDMSVRVGEHNMQIFEGREQTLPVTRIIVHPAYHERRSLNDIALLYLSRDIRYNTAVLPACLPKRDAPTDLVCVSTGWGQTQGTADPRRLNQVRVPIIDRNTCRKPYWYYRKFTDVMLCAGYPEGGKDSCQGDSGGPLVCRDNGVYRLQGITSWGFGCAQPRAPGVYTRVTRFVSWIDRHTNGTYQAPP